MTDRELLDMFLRHQIYLEAFKDNHTTEFLAVVAAMMRGVRGAFLDIEKEQMRELTRTELQTLIRRARQAQAAQFDMYTDNLLRKLERFTAIEQDIAAGMIYSKQPARIKSIWSTVKNEPMATGDLLPAFITNLSVASIAAVDKLIRSGYAHSLSVAGTLKNIIGTRTLNYRDGVFNKISNWNKAVSNTSFQHASMLAFKYEVSKEHDKYQWVSIIDNRTSEICVSRDGNIYDYETGPLPPAHPNCRSTAVPIVGSKRDVPDYKEWLETQSDEFREEMDRPLTLEQYNSKLQRMINGV